jgi:PAS domain S-box-containing protein
VSDSTLPLSGAGAGRAPTSLAQALLAAVGDAILIADDRGVCVDANPAALRLLGYPREDLIGAHLADLVPSDPETPAARRRRLHHARTWRGELELHRKDGGAARVDARTAEVALDDGIRVIVLLRDLSKPGEVEEALQASRDQLAAVLQNVADGITVQDAAGRVIYANDAAARLSGYPTGEALLAAPLSELAGRFVMLDEAGAPFPWEGLPGQHALLGEQPGPVVVRYRIVATGEERWSVVKAAPVRDVEGKVRFAVNVFSDVTPLQRARQRFAFLAEISALLAASLDYDETLQRVADLIVPELADGCVVDVLDEAGRLVRKAVAHPGPALREAIWAVERRVPVRAGAAHGPARVLASGRSELLAEITDEMLVAAARDPEHLAILRALPVRSQIVAPLVSRGEVLGTITFAYTRSGRHYGEEDLALVEEVAHRCAVAIDNARLYREARAAEQDARRQTERMTALARASRAFAEARLDTEELLATVAEQVVQATGDGCIVHLLSADGERLEAGAVRHPDPAVAALAGEGVTRASIRLGERLSGRVIRSRAPLLLVDSPEAPLRERVAEEYRPFVDVAVRCAFLLPLIVRRRPVGAMIVTRGGDRPVFTEEDQAFLQDFADRAALAIDSALRYQAEHEARAQAEEANRAKDEFLSVLSHELRTPLTSMLGWIQMLQRGRLSPAATENALRTIDRAARAQAQLIGDILDVSRIITGKLRLKPALIDPQIPVAAAVDTVRPAADAKGVALTLALGPSVGPVYADADRLQQVVWNLLSNAIKFTPRDGRVTVRLAREGDAAAISVQDTGSGIVPAFLPYVFDRFRQADASSTRAHGGLGLGLAIVRHLAELHGGSVEAASEGAGKGATFTVRIPLADDVAGMMGGPAAHTASAGRLEDATVLIVEDEPDTRDLLATLLTEEGAVVLTAGSAAEALALLDDARPDALISDIAMPGGDGYALIEQVRRRAEDAPPAIALSAYAGEEHERRALAAGYAAYLAKPFDPDELIGAVIRLTMRGTSTDSVRGAASV